MGAICGPGSYSDTLMIQKKDSWTIIIRFVITSQYWVYCLVDIHINDQINYVKGATLIMANLS